MNFKEAEEKYKKLKELYEEGVLSGEEFKKEVKKLLIRDEEGRLWTIGIKSGSWYVMTDTGWEKAKPPVVEEKPSIPLAEMEEAEVAEKKRDIALSDIIQEEQEEKPICPSCGKEVEAYFIFCPYCGARLKEVEEEEVVERPFILKMISSLSLALFLAGFGFLLGAVVGALFGGNPLFYVQEFNPLGIVRGSFLASVLYGLVGGILGFLLTFISGLIFSLFANLFLLAFGGVKFYFK